MGWVFPLQRGRGSLDLGCLDQLQGIFGLDDEFVLVSKEVSVVSEDAVVGSSWDGNTEGTVHVVSELQFEAETHGLVELPTQIHSNLLLCNANIQSLWEAELNTDIGDIIYELTLEIAVFVSVVEDSKAGGGFNVERNHRHDDLSFVEVEHGQAGGALQDDVDVFQRFFYLVWSDE